ncbi:MAG: hypothetical protein IVW51_17635 [Thermaceae bacterium]|nr:hypothetical protein [Thermaceae bacterium]
MDLQDAYIRAQLSGVKNRLDAYAEALDWATQDKPVLNWATLLPPMTTIEGIEALQRYTKLAGGIGRDVYQERLWGTLGSVGWGGTDPRVDERLKALDLDGLARQAFTPLLCGGIAAGVAYRDIPGPGEPAENSTRVDILSGYLQPLAEDGNSADIWALYQCTTNPDGKTYRVRVYDLEERQLYEWNRLSAPYHLGLPPTSVDPLSYLPRFVMAAQDENGLPVGEFVQGLSLLRDEITKQVKLFRMEEASSFSMLVLSGPFDEGGQLGPNGVLQSNDPAANATRLPPGDLTVMQSQHDRTLERIRRRFAGRARLTSGRNLSGEAIAEANQMALNAYSDYARILSRLLTWLVGDYCDLEAIDPVTVEVTVNREAYRNSRITEIITLYEKGLLSLDMAVGEISKFFSFSAEQIQSFLASRSTVTGADVQRLFGGGGNG